MRIPLYILLSLTALPLHAKNQTITSFSKAKKILYEDVYNEHRTTVYCNASFDENRQISLPKGFQTNKFKNRMNRIEAEHIVPIENIGRAFVEWRTGDKQCVNSKGKAYKGRKCAGKVNQEYRYIEANLFNLYPAIGALNASRSNYNFNMLPASQSKFGSCLMKIENRKVEPPEAARGIIARTYKYMQSNYQMYSMSKSQQQLMNAWDTMYEVTKWECKRTKKITAIQKDHNYFVENKCNEAGFW